ncbi:MAG: SxtJ family membrane protein [Candidatus Eisenbacteria bacterium]|nr:SxtJ family membrane protein [Candidatus Eisenbacteria bacterium]
MAKNPNWIAVIAEEVKAVKSDPGHLRKFGLTMGIALAVFGALFFWRGHTVAPYLFLFAAAFLLLAAVAPRALKPVQRIWMTLATVLGWVMTRVLLIIVFFIGITPIAFIARIVGKRFINLKFEPDRESYWEKREPPTGGMERYESQF